MNEIRQKAATDPYFPDTDSLYIALSSKESVDSEEIAPGFVVDYDEAGRVVGIDIDSRASELVDLSDIKLTGLGVPMPA